MQSFVGNLHSRFASYLARPYSRYNWSRATHLSASLFQHQNTNGIMPATKRRFLKTSDSVNSNEPAPTLPDGTPHDSRVAKGMIYAKEGENLPQKKFFRQRAHINPLGTAQAYEYPVDPDRMQWASHFAEVFKGPHRDQYENDLKPEIADVGCGFGGLVVNLAPHYPQSLMVGMEIRPKVSANKAQTTCGPFLCAFVLLTIFLPFSGD